MRAVEKENPKGDPGLKDRMLLMKSLPLPLAFSGTSATLREEGSKGRAKRHAIENALASLMKGAVFQWGIPL